MNELDVLEEPDDEARREAIRARLLRAVEPAIELLEREARGQRVIAGDVQLRACAALARLGRGLMSTGPREPAPASLFHPSLHPAEAARLYAEMRGEMGKPADFTTDDDDDDDDD